MPKKGSGNSPGPSHSKSIQKYLKGLIKKYYDSHSEQTDKRADPAFQAQFQQFKKLEKLYECLNRTDTYFANITKKYVIGQDEAIDSISYIIYHNMHQNMMDDFFGIDTQILSAVIVGPSGCGKTASISKLSELYGVPYVKYNATPLTSGGFVGKDVEAMLKALIKAADGDIELAEHGILYIDEIDKKASAQANNTSGRDINGTAVQEELLKFLESSVIDLGHDQFFHTNHLTILMSGRFIDLDKLRKKRVSGKTACGFGTDDNQTFEDDDYVPIDAEDDEFNEFDNSHAKTYTHQDIIKFGFLDEFVGRIFAVVEYNKLSKKDLVDVIYAKGSPLQHFLESIAVKKQELTIDPLVFERMAAAAFNSPMGARSLNSMVNEFLRPADRDFMFNYRPGIMSFDADGNYSSVFETKSGELKHTFIPSKRYLRRQRLQREQIQAIRNQEKPDNTTSSTRTRTKPKTNNDDLLNI